MQTAIIEQNELIRNDCDILVPQKKVKNKSESVDVSDRDIQFIKKIIHQTEDLSSASTELDAQWVCWSSEYHLNSMRSNLIRALDFAGIYTVLEIGAGCGAITRYLGEMDIHVDTVEENSCYASIARMRCLGLDNVNIINMNLNDLRLPTKSYDAIFMIDTFDNTCFDMALDQNHQKAVIKILTRAKSALTRNGILFIAASNRMGLKYWMGAKYSNADKAYIGIDGFPSNPVKRAYDRKEHQSLLMQAGFHDYRFAYPFPDHLLTRAILTDHYINNDIYAHSLLYHIKSRDYFNPDWRPDDDEFLRWEALHRSGYLPDFANSFLIAAANDETSLAHIWPYDFIHFSNPSRLKKYRTVTFKRRDAVSVQKERIFSDSEIQGENLIKNEITEYDYLEGSLLSSKWLHVFLAADVDLLFTGLVNEYLYFLTDYLHDNQEKNYAFDLLPFNIIIDSQGAYRAFDLEWTITRDLSPEFILFRALMWFGYTHEAIIAPFCDQRNLHCLADFIAYIFKLAALPLQNDLDHFIAIEERLHKNISSNQGPEPVNQLVRQPFQYVTTNLQSKSFNAQLYWVGENETLTDENSITVSVPLSDKYQTIFFKLPLRVQKLKIIRFDPAGRTGFLHLSSVQLKWFDNAVGDERILWELNDAHAIASHAIMENVYFCPSVLSDTFIATSDDPRIIFELPNTVGPPSMNGTFLFKAEMDWPKSADYLASVEKINQMAIKLKEKDALIAEKEKRVVEYHVQLEQQNLNEARIKELGDQVKERDIKIHVLEFKFNLIKKSGLGKIFKALKIF